MTDQRTTTWYKTDMPSLEQPITVKWSGPNGAQVRTHTVRQLIDHWGAFSTMLDPRPSIDTVPARTVVHRQVVQEDPHYLDKVIDTGPWLGSGWGQPRYRTVETYTSEPGFTSDNRQRSWDGMARYVAAFTGQPPSGALALKYMLILDSLYRRAIDGAKINAGLLLAGKRIKKRQSTAALANLFESVEAYGVDSGGTRSRWDFSVDPPSAEVARDTAKIFRIFSAPAVWNKARSAEMGQTLARFAALYYNDFERTKYSYPDPRAEMVFPPHAIAGFTYDVPWQIQEDANKPVEIYPVKVEEVGRLTTDRALAQASGVGTKPTGWSWW